MRKIAVLVSILALALSLLVTGCGDAKKTSSQTTPIDTGAGKELQVTNVQVVPNASESTSSKAVTVAFKVTNPYKDYYSYNTYVKVNLLDSQGKIVGTEDGCIWNVYPGSRWHYFAGITSVGDPAKVETKPNSQSWIKIAPTKIPKATITQSTQSGSHVVGTLKFEGSSAPGEIEIKGVTLDANGNVNNYGVT